ncbi:MAG TPA: TIR domain-containing protein [Dongiaceae bacterium]|nr:TIR domain-containing protein [Dongiaceae bacterium]
MATSVVAFVSYAHDDDENGAIVRFAEQLEKALNRFSDRRDITVFVDRNSIAWGDAWKTRIDQGLVDSMFLIAIMTPRYLSSEHCQRELRTFGSLPGWQRSLLPIYYIEIQDFETRSDPTSIALRERQYVDWLQLRTLGRRSIRLQNRIEDLARDMLRMLKRAAPAQNSHIPLANSEVSRESRAQTTALAAEAPDLMDYVFWAQAATDREDYGLARAVLLEALDRVDDPLLLYRLAVVDWYDGALDDAVREFEQTLAAGLDDIEVLHGLGQARIERGDFEQGIAELEGVLKHDPDEIARAYARSSRALGLGGLGRFQEAFDELAAAEQVTPENAWLHFNRARILDWQQDKAASQSYLRSLIFRDPPLNRPKREVAQRRLRELGHPS